MEFSGNALLPKTRLAYRNLQKRTTIHSVAMKQEVNTTQDGISLKGLALMNNLEICFLGTSTTSQWGANF